MNMENQMAMTPLYWAVYNGHKNVVQLLLDEGADPNKADNEGISPLLNAAFQNYQDMAELLISKGADLSMADQNTGVGGWIKMVATRYYGLQ